jgi:hypothetical protein
VDEKGQGYFFKQGNTNYLLQKKLEKTLTNQGLIQPNILLATEKYMLIKGVNGKNMDKVTSRESKLKVAENLGEYLAILHKNNTRGWGELIDTNKGKYKTYSDFYTYLFPCIEPGLSECIKTVLKNTNTSCLNHGDVCYTHIYKCRILLGTNRF